MSLSRWVHVRPKAPLHGDPWHISVGGLDLKAFIQQLREASDG
jgi:hypothetical protein